MKPAPFDYVAPRALEELLELLAERGADAKILAGGQSLVPVLNFRLAQPACLIDINRVAELDFVRATDDGGLAIGALARQARLERDRDVARWVPLLAEALPFVAHPQIRNRGTLGGSLAHADPAAELPAVAIASDARLRIARKGSERWIAARDFFTGLFATALEPDELLAEIVFPAREPATGTAFLEQSRRHGDYAMAGVAARIALDADGRCRVARLVYLSVGDGPVDARRAAEPLVGQSFDRAALHAAAETAASSEIDPIGDIHASAEFKRRLVRVLTVRALETAFARAQVAA